MDRLLELEGNRLQDEPLNDEEKERIGKIDEEDKKLPEIEQHELINSPVADLVLGCIQNDTLFCNFQILRWYTLTPLFLQFPEISVTFVQKLQLYIFPECRTAEQRFEQDLLEYFHSSAGLER